MIRRRLVLGALAGLVAAPPVVRATSIAPISAPRPPAPWLPPIGSVYAFPKPVFPPGWLPCDGRAFSPALFPRLARVMANACLLQTNHCPDLSRLAGGAMSPIAFAIRAR